MKIGLVQMDILWEDIRGNMRKADNFFEKAREANLELLVFPEMAFSGFSMKVDTLGPRWKEIVTYFQRKTAEYKLSAVFSCIVKEEGMEKAHNDLFLIEEGRIRMRYTKIHPFSFGREAEYYEGGDRIYAAKWKDSSLGAFICYDLRFGEIFKISAEVNPVILVIANWTDSRILHWDRLLQARAIENQCYILGVNRTGSEPRLRYNGHSAVYGPDGALLTEITEDERLITAEITPQKVWEQREYFKVRMDRREDLYRRITVTTV